MSFVGYFPPSSEVKTEDGLAKFYRTLEVVGQGEHEGQTVIKDIVLASQQDEDGNLHHVEPLDQFKNVEEILSSNGYKVKPPLTDYQLANYTKEQIAIASSIFEVEKI